MTAEEAAIEARQLVRSFAGQRAVDGVSFTITAGTITGLLGANGAGKTTTMRLLTGALAPDAGYARIAGADVVAEPTTARAMTGYLPEAASGFSHLTAAEFLLLATEARGYFGADAQNEIERVVRLLDLSKVFDQTIGTLSKGWRQRTWLGQALIGDPPVLILDEPTDGLDPVQKISLRALLAKLKAEKAILMSTHILEEAEAVCDRLIVLNQGRVVADAATGELADANGRLAPAILKLAADGTAQ